MGHRIKKQSSILKSKVFDLEASKLKTYLRILEDIDDVPLADLLRTLEIIDRYGLTKQTNLLPKEIYKELLETRAHLIPD